MTPLSAIHRLPAPRRRSGGRGVGRLGWALLVAVALLPVLAGAAAATAAHPPLVELPGMPPAPALRLPRLDVDGAGAPVDVADHAGSVVVLNFWATWCTPCRREMPALLRAAEQLREHGVVLWTVNQGDPLERVRAFLDSLGLEIPTLLDPQLSSAVAWVVRGLPTTYVLDRQGRIRYVALGERDWDDPALLAQIRALAAQLSVQLPAQ
jgi:thiol-disulfide isomerase/thioredoxin